MIQKKNKSNIFKTGMQFKIRLSQLVDVDAALIKELKKTRKAIVDELKKHYESIELTFAFQLFLKCSWGKHFCLSQELLTDKTRI